MLNDFVQMFLGAMHYFVSADNPHRDYFDCVLSVGVLLAVCVGSILIACTIVSGSFKLLARCFR